MGGSTLRTNHPHSFSKLSVPLNSQNVSRLNRRKFFRDLKTGSRVRVGVGEVAAKQSVLSVALEAAERLSVRADGVSGDHHYIAALM